jgi:hypothetical protein
MKQLGLMAGKNPRPRRQFVAQDFGDFIPR